MEIQESEFEKLKSIKESYYELIMAVENKYPNENRHQTALRLIKEAQQPHNQQINTDRATANSQCEAKNGCAGECDDCQLQPEPIKMKYRVPVLVLRSTLY